MTVCYNDFIGMADALLSQEGAIAKRCAVSRAYYGVYHAAKIYADSHGWPEIDGTSHRVLSLRFKASGHKRLAYILRDLHRDRCEADYNLEVSTSNFEREKSVMSCKKFIEKLEALDGNQSV